MPTAIDFMPGDDVIVKHPLYDGSRVGVIVASKLIPDNDPHERFAVAVKTGDLYKASQLWLYRRHLDVVADASLQLSLDRGERSSDSAAVRLGSKVYSMPEREAVGVGATLWTVVELRLNVVGAWREHIALTSAGAYHSDVVSAVCSHDPAEERRRFVEAILVVPGTTLRETESYASLALSPSAYIADASQRK